MKSHGIDINKTNNNILQRSIDDCESDCNCNSEREEEDCFISDSSTKIEQLELVQDEEIVVISTSMPLMRSISFISSIVFFVLLFIRFFFNWQKLSFLLISIPLSITIISLILYLNSSIMYHSIIAKGKWSKLHSMFYYTCLNSAGISLLVFICLFSLRVEGFVMNDYFTIVKPLCFSCVIYLLYLLFIMLIVNNSINNWFIHIPSFIDAICIIMTGFALLKENGARYSFAFSCCYLCLGINEVALWLNDSKSRENYMKMIGIGVIWFGIGIFHIKLKLLLENDSHWFEVGLIGVGYLMICFEFLIGTFKEDIIAIKKAADTKLV